MPYFVFRLLPPRPSFAQDADERESAIMAEHGEYWRLLTEAGTVLVFGPVGDPAGVWGLGVIEAAHHDTARRLADADPAVISGTCRSEVLPMLSATLRPDQRRVAGTPN